MASPLDDIEPLHLECGLCIVRDWRASDLRSLVRHANERAVWRNLTHRFPSPYTEKDAESWLKHVTTSDAATNWAIEVDGYAVGAIGVDRGMGVYVRTGRFGYWLGRDYWGRGIVTAAVRAVVPYIFEQYHLDRLEAPVFEWNPASMRVLEKCGFAREGVLRRSIFKDGQLIDAVMYAMTRE